MARKSETFRGPDSTSLDIVDASQNTLDEFGLAIDFDALATIQRAPAMLTGAERLSLFSLIYGVRPTRYLEVGIRHGGASLIASRAMDAANYDGKLILVDANPEVDDETWQQIEHRSTLVKGWSPGVLREAADVAGGSFDFVFIDAGHDFRAVMRDTSGVFPYLADGAYILFHDSFRDEVDAAIGRFVAMHPLSIVDFGLITRQFTQRDEFRDKAGGPMSCGFRLAQYRRRHGWLRPFRALMGLFYRMEVWFFNLTSFVREQFRRVGRFASRR
jgi:predicted O-methyltransferase YrrM